MTNEYTTQCTKCRKWFEDPGPEVCLECLLSLEVEELRLRLAAALIAAEGHTPLGAPAECVLKCLAVRTVKQLRSDHDRLEQENSKLRELVEHLTLHSDCVEAARGSLCFHCNRVFETVYDEAQKESEE
jgi:hypothetical protein